MYIEFDVQNLREIDKKVKMHKGKKGLDTGKLLNVDCLEFIYIARSKKIGDIYI